MSLEIVPGRRRLFIGKLSYAATVPDPPFEPKSINLPMSPFSFTSYRLASLEAHAPVRMTSMASLAALLPAASLLDAAQWDVPRAAGGQHLHPDDALLLGDMPPSEEAGAQNRRGLAAIPTISLVGEDYTNRPKFLLASELTKASMDAKAARADPSDLLSLPEQQRLIESTFKAFHSEQGAPLAGSELLATLVHPTKPHLKAVAAEPIFPLEALAAAGPPDGGRSRPLDPDWSGARAVLSTLLPNGPPEYDAEGLFLAPPPSGPTPDTDPVVQALGPHAAAEPSVLYWFKENPLSTPVGPRVNQGDTEYIVAGVYLIEMRAVEDSFVSLQIAPAAGPKDTDAPMDTGSDSDDPFLSEDEEQGPGGRRRGGSSQLPSSVYYVPTKHKILLSRAREDSLLGSGSSMSGSSMHTDLPPYGFPDRVWLQRPSGQASAQAQQ
ncbi:hypothetical protein H696_05620 [Fonticula alba]|uniref:Uncharacterized protein n=1 Tax=Fonticula alba TaxID=691883 RepID=A0A058Z180_FONAL|nr:hypothetical protein H696_05620 [Fonticula alba]KCV67891.1 hypothetical protein H696_05620 [Fonticula alba]|eukprot:XP_009497711.1 hypothetical protein H696_05620 [Fonticula alba]